MGLRMYVIYMPMMHITKQFREIIMSKITMLGLAGFVTGLALLVFKAIASAVGKVYDFPNTTIEQSVSPESITWITEMSDGLIHSFMMTLVTAPLYAWCIIGGILLMVIGGLIDK